MSLTKSFLLFLMLLTTTLVFADGCYKSIEEVLPEITGQQAIIKHKDGMQTMIIESSLDSKAQELGWIVPLPSEPTEVKRVDSNIFAEMNRDMPIKLEKPPRLGSVVMGMIFLLLLLAAVFSKDRFLIKFFVLFLVGLILLILSAPTLAKARGVGQGVSVLKDEIVGDYQRRIQVISA